MSVSSIPNTLEAKPADGCQLAWNRTAGGATAAIEQRVGDDVDEASKRLAQEGFPKGLVKEAMQIAEQQGRFTIFALVDALTRLSQRITLAGDRVQLDAKIGQLLSLAA
jgi:histone H3/H4